MNIFYHWVWFGLRDRGAGGAGGGGASAPINYRFDSANW